MVYVCTLCGYEYSDAEPTFEDLADDWVCPMCGAGKSMFAEK
ncbi:MAG: rubredoxin [Methanobrevibacter sp.]|jgi:rubredoxin|nr:rubredoxin [Candidatus Methanoflexus mossambicus]